MKCVVCSARVVSIADCVKIRTPLHAVNGYCELLAMTNLTEEQTAYVSSIQQACHAINVIAGNVLGQSLQYAFFFIQSLMLCFFTKILARFAISQK